LETDPVLAIENLNVYYGESHVVRDVSFRLGERETIAVMGRNGMGKTTLFKALIGLLPVGSGRITLQGRDITRAKSYERVAAGLAYVPQGRMVFPYLTVEENLLAGLETVPERTVPGHIYDTFPVLAQMRWRLAGNLSGGQQQQLAIARALVARPAVLLLDEPTEGVQPSIIKEIARTLNALRSVHGFAMVLSEQVLSFAIEIADRFLILDKGEIAYEGLKADVDTAKIHAHLTV
jgi:urea transport system ATP-binding protein